MIVKQVPVTIRRSLVVSLLALSPAAMASTIHYDFSGVITAVPTAMTSIAVGDSWSASLVIDSNAPAATISLPHPSLPLFTAGTQTSYAGLSGTLSIGSGFSYTFDTGANLRVSNDAVVNGMMLDGAAFISSASNLSLDGLDIISVRVGFQTLLGQFANLIDDTSMPSQATLASFPQAQMALTVVDNATGSFGPGVTGSLSSLSVTASPVPVPAAAWLFGSALLGLVARARHHP